MISIGIKIEQNVAFGCVFLVYIMVKTWNGCSLLELNVTCMLVVMENSIAYLMYNIENLIVKHWNSPISELKPNKVKKLFKLPSWCFNSGYDQFVMTYDFL